MNITQANKDAAYYLSYCILKRLQAMGLLTDAEVEKIRAMSQEHYGSKLICV
ncbi:MAG: SHOCT domain-containing protein [Eubacteriales bacterium]